MTSSTITIGNVADISGPIPGLFQGAPDGVSAYVAYVNAHGGVDGRKLVLSSKDDATTCPGNEQATQALSSQVIAFVGNFSLEDNCGAAVLKTVPTVPDVSFGLTDAAKALATNFSPSPQPTGYIKGPFIYYKAHYPKAVLHVAALPESGSGSLNSWAAQKADMQSLGYHVVYTRAYNPTDTDFTSDIIRMRDLGVQFLWLTDTDPATQGRILAAAAQQNWHPQVLAGGNSYDPNFSKLVSPADSSGILQEQQTALYLGEDRATDPGVALFLTWLNKTHPGFQPDIFTVYGWTSAMLLVEALKSAGANPTGTKVLTALKKIHHFDGDGLLAPADPGSKTPSPCWLMLKIQNGKYVRVLPKTNGFTCSPGGYYYYHAS